jgi:D-alanyl-D-alanine carboxypeptidase (penicillin-binding protein 5/6)
LASSVLLALAPAAARDIESPDPDAEIALLVDLSAGGQVLFAREASKPFLPASITKAMSAQVAFALIRAGKLDLSAQFPVRAETLARWAPSGTSMQLKPGDRVAVRDLLRGMTTVSANDAAAVLAEGAGGSVENWIALMNVEAAKRGMRGSHFASPNGLPDSGRTVVTAPDLVRLADALIYAQPSFYADYIGQKRFTWQGVTQDNRDPTIGVVAGADGIKTGHTNEAGFTFLGSAERNGRRLVVVTARSASEAGRATSARALLEWGFAAWDSHPLYHSDQQVGQAQVQLGDATRVGLVVPRDFTLATRKGAAPAKISACIRYDGPIRAPIKAGAVVAVLEISIDAARHSLPLVAESDVGVAGPFDRLINGVVGLFR